MASVGDTVLYRATEEDCAPWLAEWEEIPQLARNMSKPVVGQQYAAAVVGQGETGLNLRVLLDGRDADLWVKDRVEGTEPGTWAARTGA